MRWIYTIGLMYVHVRVEMGGETCGNLMFTQEQFKEIMDRALKASPMSPIYSFEEVDV